MAEQFFDRELCASLRSEAASAPGEAAGIYAAVDTIDVATRRSSYAQVSPETVALVTARLLAIKPELEHHFRLQLQGCQTPHFLVYRPGDFFRAHTDIVVEGTPPYIQERLISVVIFLNEEFDRPTADAFSGGSLTFYNLVDDEHFRNLGLPLAGEEGLLVAFRADIVHAVTPVTHGRRFTIVTWFC